MKRIKLTNMKWFALFICLPFLVSCNWEDLPSYEEAEISQAVFYYRWDSGKKDPITNEPIMAEKQLTCSSEIDKENAIVNVAVTIPAADATFTENIRTKVTQNPLWGTARISTAARIFPIDGSAALGTPDDWTKEHKFRVEAANGTSKVWTIKIVQFNR